MTTTSSLARHYGLLTPEERFRLILAAGARGDEAEQGRLRGAGRRIRLEMPDHAPWAHAFQELALRMFLDLLEDAAGYCDSFLQADAAEDPGAHEAESGATAASAAAAGAAAGPDHAGRSPGERRFQAAMALGFLLKVKADGWRLFCARLNVPPFALWRGLPGRERLQQALRLAEQAAFVPEGMLRWLNAVRPAGAAEIVDVGVTTEASAAGLERLFRERVGWWGGE